MNAEEWYRERDSRTRIYNGAQLIDPDRWIHIHVAPEAAESFDGQVTVMTLTNLIGRMCRKVSISTPAAPIVSPLPGAGDLLGDFLIHGLGEAAPYGQYDLRKPRSDDTVISVGPTGRGPVIHGAGWSSYFGPSPSPLGSSNDVHNPFGPAFAAITAVASLYHSNFEPVPSPVLVNTATWQPGLATISDFPSDVDLGEVWAIGVGSVGSAILYFLALATRSFKATLFDMDQVKIHNLDRSPIFLNRHIDLKKVDAVADYLRARGCTSATPVPHALHESETFKSRPAGRPDLLFSAANELNVRSTIEDNYPPVQVYGTTGKAWQAALLRHIPGNDPCSCCVFPPETFEPTDCATASVNQSNSQDPVDAAVPFLSFAAGLMAAAETIKLHLDGFPFSPNRVVYNTRTGSFNYAPLYREKGCPCQSRDPSVHEVVVGNSLYAKHSEFSAGRQCRPC